MPYYEICLIGGDGSPLCCERHLATDLETVWGVVFRMAETKRGKRIHVLDEDGETIIRIGAKSAALSAERVRALREPSRHAEGERHRASRRRAADGRGG